VDRLKLEVDDLQKALGEESSGARAKEGEVIKAIIH